jgi:hypothetical protein
LSDCFCRVSSCGAAKPCLTFLSLHSWTFCFRQGNRSDDLHAGTFRLGWDRFNGGGSRARQRHCGHVLGLPIMRSEIDNLKILRILVDNRQSASRLSLTRTGCPCDRCAHSLAMQSTLFALFAAGVHVPSLAPSSICTMHFADHEKVSGVERSLRSVNA